MKKSNWKFKFLNKPHTLKSWLRNNKGELAYSWVLITTINGDLRIIPVKEGDEPSAVTILVASTVDVLHHGYRHMTEYEGIPILLDGVAINLDNIRLSQVQHPNTTLFPKPFMLAHNKGKY